MKEMGKINRNKTHQSANHLHKSRGPFYLYGLTLILSWISNYIHYNVWEEIIYQFPNFNGCTVEVWNGVII